MNDPEPYVPGGSDARIRELVDEKISNYREMLAELLESHLADLRDMVQDRIAALVPAIRETLRDTIREDILPDLREQSYNSRESLVHKLGDQFGNFGESLIPKLYQAIQAAGVLTTDAVMEKLDNFQWNQQDKRSEYDPQGSSPAVDWPDGPSYVHAKIPVSLTPENWLRVSRAIRAIGLRDIVEELDRQLQQPAKG